MMNYTIDLIITKTSKPFLYVDFNELLDNRTVMLSQQDIKNDYYGNPVKLHEGLEIIGYQEDSDMNGVRDDIILEGVCVNNLTRHSTHVKWLLKANEKGIQYVSDIIK